MTNITEILKKYGLEIAEDKKDEFNKELSANYKTIAEFSNLQERYDADIKTRDADLETLRGQLSKAGDNSGELEKLKGQLSGLQTKYDADKTAYENKLKEQQYDFIVNKFADGLEFTSNGAKKAFISDLKAKDLPLNESKDRLMGTEDFVKDYKEKDSGAFKAIEKPNSPKFSTSTNGKNGETNTDWKPPILW